MAAVLSPPHLHPGLIRLPGLTAPRRARPAPRLAPAAPVAPTAATYRRRQAVALLLLVVVTLAVQLVLSSAVLSVATRATGATAVPATQGRTTVATADAPTAPGGATAAASGAASSVYVVRSGDTLWSIARRLQPDADPRPLVDALAERAGSSALRPGQRIDLDGLAL